ncbi:deoxyribose-phosphate aldolase [Pontivivens insulae]|uniref:Deoxyribose-phosphate aldolase n=1 Tax=Pontivivens insulae TaxID=1639689 RepID=A0A2R8AE70_9RHOB|nr:deoxyribose-phosphate aldolase [Pontivivens insulae]RED14265.1 deoxyribose-phosphate aldolase [Pontivivens insulae]SPF30340.1 Deoxyribose-phosphate aldolase [Pontivivens insulae]
MSDLKAAAKLAISCLDLTNLNDDCTEEDVRELCARARTPHGNTAAVCLWPRFVPVAKEALAGSGIRIATVVNFPGGMDEVDDVLDLTEQAVRDGADEIDMVIPYPKLIEGHAGDVSSLVRRIRKAGDGALVKSILETGMLANADTVRAACKAALDGGAHFLKTSTGKVPVNATPTSARLLLEAIRDNGDPSIGFKPAGGVKTTEDARDYINLANEIMGDGWATPQTFRLGASGVLTALLATLNDADAPNAAEGY